MQRVGRPFTNCCPLVFPSRTNAFLHTSLLVGSHSPSLFQVTKTGGLLPPCPLLTVHSLAKLALPQRCSRRFFLLPGPDAEPSLSGTRHGLQAFVLASSAFPLFPLS